MNKKEDFCFTKVLPYKVDKGRIYEVEIVTDGKSTIIPLSNGIPFEDKILQTFALVDWNELRRDDKSFRAQHKATVMNELSKLEKEILHHIWKNGTIDFSISRLKKELKLGPSSVTQAMRGLKMASIVTTRQVKRFRVVQLTAFGSEICTLLFPSDRVVDVGRELTSTLI